VSLLRHWKTILELAGAVLLVAAAALVHPALALTVAGVALVAVANNPGR
jgi:hypothetical protein